MKNFLTSPLSTPRLAMFGGRSASVLLLIALFLALSSSARGAVTWTLVQHVHNFTCTTSGVCTIGSSQGMSATTAGDLLILASTAFEGTTGGGSISAAPSFSSASGDSTWTHCSSVAKSYTTSGPEGVAGDCAYILSAAGGATSVSWTWNWGTVSGASPLYYIDVELVEVKPSTGYAAAFDKGSGVIYATGVSGSNCQSCALPSLSINGSSDYILGWGWFDNADPTGPGSPWTNPADLSGQTYSGYIGALNQSSGPSVSLNQGASSEAVTFAIAFTASSSGNTYTATPSETNTASDSLGRVLGTKRGDTETNTASDALARLLNALRGDSETNLSTDGLGRVGALVRGDSETNTASDSITGMKNSGAHAYNASPSETNTASDTLGRLAAFLRGDSESNSSVDGLGRLASWLRADAETNTASDSVSRATALWRGNVIALYWQPTAAGSGNSSYTYSVYRGVSSGGEGSTPIASGLDAGCSGYVSCFYLDYNVSPGTTYYYEVAAVYSGQTSPVSSEVALLALPAMVAETNTASASLTRSHGVHSVMSETNPSTDGLGRAAGFSRSDLETNAASDALARSAAWLRSDSETNPSTDGLGALHTGTGIHNALMSESLVLTDALGRLGTYERYESETNTAIDALVRVGGFGRGLAETKLATDSLARLGVFLRGASETVVSLDVLVSVRGGTIIVLPGHQGKVPGRTKTGTATPH